MDLSTPLNEIFKILDTKESVIYSTGSPSTNTIKYNFGDMTVLKKFDHWPKITIICKSKDFSIFGKFDYDGKIIEYHGIGDEETFIQNQLLWTITMS
ncbi:MAG: hypothetical protein WC284_08225 [Candidimonas sp.]